jgi:hypothetical protein
MARGRRGSLALRRRALPSPPPDRFIPALSQTTGKDIVSTVKTAETFGLPIVHSTINVASGRERPTVPELEEGT